MELNCKKTDKGIVIRCKNRNFNLSYPEKIWGSYPKNIKEVLVDNLAHLLTINLPLVAGIEKLKYNTSYPLFKPFFDAVVINSLPAAVEDYNIRTEDVIKQFLNTDYEFNSSETKLPSNYNFEPDKKAIVSLSCGKDSLLSLAVCNEIGLDPIAVYVDSTVSRRDKIRVELGKKLSRELKIKYYLARNKIEKLNDFEFWKNPESCIGYTHLVTSFCLISLPFLHYFRVKYIVIGNQKNMEFRFNNKDGFFTYPAFDQSIKWTKEQDNLIGMMTNHKSNIISVIEPLTNIAIMRILHRRYGNFGKYMVSCDSLDASREKRWCQNCSKCARLSLLMKANNIDIETVGLKKNLLTKRSKGLYCLFEGKEVDSYEKSREARDEQLLAFYMAYRNGEKGYLIDLFKKKFLEEAKSREDELIKRFFSIHNAVTIPKNIKERIFSIYREELKDLF